MVLSSDLGELMEWRTRWLKEIPYIKFPGSWEVQIVPPSLGAVIRYRVKLDGTPDDNDISVYLDGYDVLGCFGEPYWEIYPAEDGDTERFALNEIDDLIRGLWKALIAINNMTPEMLLESGYLLPENVTTEQLTVTLIE